MLRASTRTKTSSWGADGLGGGLFLRYVTLLVKSLLVGCVELGSATLHVSRAFSSQKRSRPNF